MRQPDLEMDLLRAFVAVAETGGFTAASEIVGRSQSAVSQKILRLEDSLGKRLFERTSRSLSLTIDGEQLLISARRILDLNDIAIRQMLEPKTVGGLRLGVSEDFVPQLLPSMLARFRKLYPGVHLELMTGLSCGLLAAYDEGALDAVIAKKDGLAQRGRVIWREPLVWMASIDYVTDLSRPLPLVLLNPPCTYREVMVQSLENMRREWIPVCTASSLMGIQAAVAGGLGVTVLGRSFAQQGLKILRASENWPALQMTEIVLVGEETARPELIQPLVAHLTATLASETATME